MFIKSNIKIVARFTITIFCLVALISAVQAGLIAYEPFNYTSTIPNGSATTASGFSGSWACGTTPSIAAGMTYTGLPTANGSFSSTSGRQSVNFASPLSSGTKWISFLFNEAGNNGGNYCGVYFPNGGTGLFFGYGFNPVDTATGALRPGSILTTGTAVADATSLASSFTGTYGATPYFVALKIDFNTSNTNDTVTIYINPTANSATPGVAATYTVTNFDVGTITGIGFQNKGGGFAVKADEIRVGDSYADVAGVGSVVTVAAPVITGIAPGTGLTSGGTVVTITGSNFLSGATVKFGANAGTGISLVSSNSITATTSAGAPGAVNVVVLNTNALSATNINGFTYVSPPPPPVTIFATSVVRSGANLNFIWKGGTNTTSVLLTSTNVGPGAIWTPVTTNVFGGDGWSSNSMPINPGEVKRFYALSSPVDIIVVQAPTSLHTTASGSTNAIGLTWAASPTTGVVGYRILYGTNSLNLANSMDVGNVTSAIISGLISGQTYYVSVITLTANGQSLAADSTITAQPDTTAAIIPLFDASTVLEPDTISNTPTALITQISDRPRGRHARENGPSFSLYDTYLIFYWEQRMTTIEIDDTIGKGGNSITFHMHSLNGLDTPNIRFFFQGQTTVAQYGDNEYSVQADSSLTNWTFNLTHNATGGALQPGDKIEFEFSPFMLTVSNGQLNYYGGAILYVAGQGIVPWQAAMTDIDLNPANDGPLIGGVRTNIDSYPLPTNAWLAGGLTMPYQYSGETNHLFNQLSPNASPLTGEPFLLGRRLHETDFGDGTHNEPGNPVYTSQVGKLGPKFTGRSCVACHVNNGRALPPAIGAPMLQSVVKVGSDAIGTPDPILGSVLQPQITSGSPEDSATISSYTTINGQYGDGTAYTLQKPNYTFSGRVPAFFSVRLTPQLVGMGLLEAVSESTVQNQAMADVAGTNGISGRVQTVTDPQTGQQRLGRFGYKGGKARVSHQVASALNADMGVTTSIFPVLDGDTSSGPVELADSDLANWVRYVSALGVNARRNLTDPQALQGEQLFASANCAQCHTPTLQTSSHHPMAELRNQTIHPYTDLLLHDLGPGLADNLGEGSATGSQWRTAPLWSIGLTPGISGGEAYLHDGRARSLEEAILWHDGEAGASKEAFRTMSASDRAALIKFLKSL
jgi:CxxC motif-containing protein (DUF1111 family)